MSDQAQITVRRTTSYADRLRDYKVKVDRVVVGSVGPGEAITIPISAGRRSLVIRIDWCGSEQIDFEVQPGQHVSFECGSNLTGWRILLTLLYITFRTNQYLWLRRITLT
jgi:hypothetical protein